MCTLAYSPQAKAVIILQVQQVGSDVVVTGSGRANFSALTFDSSDIMYQNVLTDVQLYAGPNVPNGGVVDLYTGVNTGPTSVSSNQLVVEEPDESSAASHGDLFGIVTSPYTLVLPKGYISNSELSGVSTFRNQTIAGLGLRTGTSTWTWGTGSDFDSINLVVPNRTPVPAPLPLAGAAVMFGWSKKLRSRINIFRSF